MPVPVATGDAATRSTPSTSSAAVVPTTSTTASWPPTSWKWTSAGSCRCSAPSTSASASNAASDRCATRLGQLRRRHEADDVGVGPGGRVVVTATTARVHAIPPRSTGSLRRSQPGSGSRRSRATTSSRSAPASSEAAERHVAGDAGEAVEPGEPFRVRHRRRRATAHAAPKPLSMPTTVIPDAHDASIASSAVTPSSDGAVADAGRHGDDRCAGDPADQAGQRTLHARHHDDRVGLGELVGRGEQPVETGDPAVGEQLGAEPERVEHRAALAGHRQVGGPGRHDDDRPVPAGRRPPGHRRQRPGPGHDAVAVAGRPRRRPRPL